MSHSENQNGVMRYLVAVQCQIAGLSARDDQLANIVFDRPAHERMVRKDIDRLDDQLRGRMRGIRIACAQEIGEPIEVGQRVSRIDQLRQVFNLGLRPGVPAARARKYA